MAADNAVTSFINLDIKPNGQILKELILKHVFSCDRSAKNKTI